MTYFIFGVAAGIVFKVLVPIPMLDDRIRAGWRWLADKVTT